MGFGSHPNITLNTQCVHPLDSTPVCHTDLCRPQSVVGFPEHQTVSARIPAQPVHSLCGYSTTTNTVVRDVRNVVASSFAAYNEPRGRANSKHTVLTDYIGRIQGSSRVMTSGNVTTNRIHRRTIDIQNIR